MDLGVNPQICTLARLIKKAKHSKVDSTKETFSADSKDDNTEDGGVGGEGVKGPKHMSSRVRLYEYSWILTEHQASHGCLSAGLGVFLHVTGEEAGFFFPC
jgi:hypothetical protein